MGDRVILHCDLNCFFASVELLDKPALWEVPVAVCGDPKSRHGIILAKNEPAKRRGVKTAETIWQARKKCPGLVLLPPHHELYREYSRRVNEIYDRFTDLEKKAFMNSFIERVEIYPERRSDGRIVKRIEFRFPVYFNGSKITGLGWDETDRWETVMEWSKLSEAEQTGLR